MEKEYTLIQKYWSSGKEFKITNNGVQVKIKEFTEDLEYTIKFDELGFDIQKRKIKNGQYAFYFFVILTPLYAWFLIESFLDNSTLQMKLFWIFGLVFFLMLAIFSFIDRKRSVIYLTGGFKSLELFGAKPDEDTVQKFIGTLHQSMREYYRLKYAKFDLGTPLDVYAQNLKWLNEMQVISKSEFEQLFELAKTQNLLGSQDFD